MKKFLSSLFFGKNSAAVFAAVSALTVLLSYSFRTTYVFVDSALFMGFSLMLFIIEVIAVAMLTAFTSLEMKKSALCEKKPYRVFKCAAEAFTLIYGIYIFINSVTQKLESVTVALRLCKEFLPLWAAAVGLLFALFILPCLKSEKAKKIISASMAAVLAVTVYASFFPVSPHKFTSGPVVFDNGESYSVVFSTNDNGTAYVEYEYGGEKIIVHDENNGRKNGGSLIHTVKIPYERLSGSTYKVVSTRVIDELSYGGRNGKTIESESITFNDNFGETVNALAVSDWHTHNGKAKKAIENLGEYNAVILLGDCSPGLMFEGEVADYILSFASEVSGGAMPVIFTRGNHETRGKEAGSLAGYLGMDEFYYTAKLGDYNFIVLDSGEDKTDDNAEYGGMVLYEQSRREMINWLASQENPENKKTIALSHSNEICIEEELAQSAEKKLGELGTSLLVSGHWHETKFSAEGTYPVLVDGGYGAGGMMNFVASKLTLSPDSIKILCADSKGEKVIEETVLWK